jgi:hypothetical protein
VRSGGWFRQGGAANAPFQPVIDLDLRKRRRLLSSAGVFELLHKLLPSVASQARARAGVVSVSFPAAPEKSVRLCLSEIGFSWVPAQQSWQHPCGRFAAPSRQAARS